MDERLPQVDVIPAQPGYFQLEPCFEEDDRITSLWETPIVAWRVTTHIRTERERITGKGESYSCVEAVTVEGVDCNDSYAVLRPDGKVESPHIGWWDSKEEFLQYLIEERQKRKAPRAA